MKIIIIAKTIMIKSMIIIMINSTLITRMIKSMLITIMIIILLIIKEL